MILYFRLAAVLALVFFTSPINFWRKGIHQQKSPLPRLMAIDQWNQTTEMLGLAMRIQRRAIRPFLYENEMAGIFLLGKKMVGNAIFFLSRLFDQLLIERSYRIEKLGQDEILRNYFQHAALS